MSADVVIVGGGVVGAACAYYAARAGRAVTVVDRGPVAGGTTGAGEGNVLVSDKPPGPELDLALLSVVRWRELAEAVDPAAIEFDPKGGLVVAETARGYAELASFATTQAGSGVQSELVAAEELHSYEPNLADDLAGGVAYPQDGQVQPMLAAAQLLREARRHGAVVRTGVEVIGARRGRGGTVHAVTTTEGTIPTEAVVNAAGTWGGEVARRLGAPVPVAPRRGFVLVTEPLPRVVRRKVYAADYVANVASDAVGLETSAVIEGTRSGTMLLGSSRERVGFDRTLSVAVMRRLAEQAVRLFPRLADVAVMRTYRGFRPYCPDHLPVVGADPRLPGVYHACGHEGAGVGLAAGTGSLIGQVLVGAKPDLDLAPYRPDRFSDQAVDQELSSQQAASLMTGESA